jgi:hypothetical protein
MADDPDLFGAGAEPRPSPSGGLLSPYLRHDSHGDKALGLSLTRNGMAALLSLGRVR